MTPKSTTRAAIYARQSVAADELLTDQIARCRDLASAKGFEVVEVYSDNNVSGYKAREAGTAFSRMLEDARAGRFDVLIVRKLDRLGRSLSALEAFAAAPRRRRDDRREHRPHHGERATHGEPSHLRRPR